MRGSGDEDQCVPSLPLLAGASGPSLPSGPGCKPQDWEQPLDVTMPEQRPCGSRARCGMQKSPGTACAGLP